jgi:2-iminobutanoate/2-iminopropanoate deaminase
MTNTNSNTNTTQPTKVFGPYSSILQAGDMYFTAGHIGVDAASGTAKPDTAMQTKKALENLMDTLASVGLASDDVVKTTIFVTDMQDFYAVNEVYVSFFTAPRPARSTIGVKELPQVAGDVPIKIEIEAVAMRNARRQG